MMHQMFRSGLQAGQFSTWTLILRSHAVVIAAVCGFALSCWNTQGLPWNRHHLEGSICCSKTFIYLSAFMNEWMMHYIALLLCIVVHPKHFTVMWGVCPQPPSVFSIHLDDATAATGQRRQCAHHTSYRWRGERVIEPIQWMGIIRRPWLTRARGVTPEFGQDTGLHPYSLREVAWIFNDHRESGPRFNVSSERRCFLTV